MGPRQQRLRRRALAKDSDDGNSALPQDEQLDLLAQAAMHDLGLARRNDITTADNVRRARVHLPTLYRNREVNVKGSEAARKASENKLAIEAWNNLPHIGDGTDGPNLADMNQGQEHRAELSRAVKIAKQEMADAGMNADTMFPQDHHDGRRQYRTNQNDRGRADKYGGTRGSARPSGRPLDPAVDPNREYTYRKSQTPYANTGTPARGLPERRGNLGSTRGGHHGSVSRHAGSDPSAFSVAMASNPNRPRGTLAPVSRLHTFNPAKLATNPMVVEPAFGNGFSAANEKEDQTTSDVCSVESQEASIGKEVFNIKSRIESVEQSATSPVQDGQSTNLQDPLSSQKSFWKWRSGNLTVDQSNDALLSAARFDQEGISVESGRSLTTSADKIQSLLVPASVTAPTKHATEGHGLVKHASRQDNAVITVANPSSPPTDAVVVQATNPSTLTVRTIPDPAKLGYRSTAIAPREILASADKFWEWCGSLKGLGSVREINLEPSSLPSTHQSTIATNTIESPIHEYASVTGDNITGDNFTDGLLTPVSNTVFSSPSVLHDAAGIAEDIQTSDIGHNDVAQVTEAISDLTIHDVTTVQTAAKASTNLTTALSHTDNAAQSKLKLTNAEVLGRIENHLTTIEHTLPRNPFGNDFYTQTDKSYGRVASHSTTFSNVTNSQVESASAALRERDGNAQTDMNAKLTGSPTSAAFAPTDTNPRKTILGQQQSRGRSTINNFLESRWASSSQTRGTSRRSQGVQRTRAGPGLATLTADLEAAGISIAELQASAERQSGRPVLNASMVQIEPDHQRSPNPAVFRSQFALEGEAVPATRDEARNVVASGSSSISRHSKPISSYSARLNFGTYRNSGNDDDSTDSEL